MKLKPTPKGIVIPSSTIPNVIKRKLAYTLAVNRRIWIASLLGFAVTAAHAENSPHNSTTNNNETTSLYEVMQQTTINGVVVDSKGEPIIGATILEKGTTNGTITDFDGNFTLSVEKGAKLLVSYIGYVSKEIVVTEAGNVKVTLEEDSESLEEIVVVGYGTQKKANLTGSVSAIDSKQLGGRALTSVAAGMQGTMPGVTIKSSTGQPGLDDGGTQIRVRGTGTFNNASPMVVVDGMESTMYDLDPNDIESISVLKDAASAAIYGSKAANGVIVVTTKRGKAGKSLVSYAATFGWQSPTRLANYVNSADYARLTNEARANEGYAPLYTAEDIRLFETGESPDTHANTDWLGLFYDQSGFQQTHNLNLSGGSESVRYMVSMGYSDQGGLIRNSEKDKYNIRINLDAKISERLEGAFNMIYTREDITYPGNPKATVDEEIFYVITKLSPMVPCYKANGDYGYIGDGNPIAWLEKGGVKASERNNIQSIGSLKYYLLPELTIKAMATYKLYYGETHHQQNAVRYDASYTHGSIDKLTESVYRDDRITGDLLLEYKRTLGKGHNLNALAGYHAELYRNYYLEAYRENFPNNSLTDLDAAGTLNQTNKGNTRELAMLSYFGRVNYDYMGKYLFEANLRYDGTSRFARGNRWGVFPSVSAGWRFSEENFFESFKTVVDSSKLRISWGKLGNQDIGGYYPTVSTLALGMNYPFGGSIYSGAYTSDAVNANLKWEATTTYGVGLDLTLFGNLNITMDYYNKTTDGILMNVVTPSTFALSNFYDNVGKVENKGFEFSALYNGNIGKVYYNLGGNIAFNKNTILDMGSGNNQYQYDINGGLYGIMRTGESMNSFFGYKSAGYFQTDEEAASAYPKGTNIGYTPKAGDIRYLDLNNDGMLDANDRAVLGSWDPGITFGFNLGAQYNGFDLTLVLQGATNVNGYVSREGVGYINGDTAKPTTLWLDHWTPENPNAATPRLIQGMEGWSMPTITSDFWMQDATYLRMKTLQLGYTFPKEWLRKMSVENLRIYYTAENLLTLTSFMDGYDPELPVAANSLRGSIYPQTQTHSFGINLTF
ncbi:MAG: SusC/RagA family TonB-linked outer membrane protein [Phocaeicola sp.]